jgi:spore germination cell wall hydrolase CwlJ-like protein
MVIYSIYWLLTFNQNDCIIHEYYKVGDTLLIRIIIAVAMIFAFGLSSITHYAINSQSKPSKVEGVNIDDLYGLKQQIRLSQSNKTIPHTKKDIHCMTQNIFFEAGTEDDMGKYAVAQVTVNRLELGYWGSSICKVVYSKGQFSWTDSRRLRTAKVEGKNWEESYKVAISVLDGMRVRNLEKALFYHADYVNPFWTDPRSMITKIGQHIFYARAEGSWLAVE